MTVDYPANITNSKINFFKYPNIFMGVENSIVFDNQIVFFISGHNNRFFKSLFCHKLEKKISPYVMNMMNKKKKIIK